MSYSNTPVASKQTSWLSRYREVMAQGEADEEFELMSAYVAGVIDATSTVTVVVGKQHNSRLGYSISPRIALQRHQGEIIHVIDNWALEHGIRGKLNQQETEKGVKSIYKIESRDDVEKFLELIEPYLIVRHNEVDIMLHEIIPRLRDGRHTSKDGFVEVMEYADMVRDSTGTRGSKYDKSYFEELWDDDL